MTRQHFVPRFYLNEFGEEIFVYDKTDDKQFPTNSSNLALKKDFYKIQENDENLVEKLLSKSEDKHAPAFKKLINERNYYILDDEDKFSICEFISLLHMRTEEKRFDLRHITDAFLDEFAKSALPPKLKKIYAKLFKYTYTDEGLKALHVKIMLDSFIPFSIIFYHMRFVMIENKTCYSFWTSDNPISRQNEFDKSGFGNLGLTSKGIQFYLPLTPDLTLGIFDPVTYWIIPLWINADKMYSIRLNFLQTDSSRRFIYSKYEKFYLLKNMLDSNSHYRNPNRQRFEMLKGTDNQGRMILMNAERNLRNPVDPTKPIGKLETWMEPSFVKEIHKKYNMKELYKKYNSKNSESS